ncbi:nuclear factor of activated T-cells 5-like [Salvelinus sp. IW2-2015]|uniref:nuclear factor of activated T-cells 5-like n=1 Tax=Salvelinus sp. IW2-2015 TaxID=2691554 RepID=UPI0038D451A7
MPSDFISLLSADLDLNSPKSLYSKESVYDLLPKELQLPSSTQQNPAAAMSQKSGGEAVPPPSAALDSVPRFRVSFSRTRSLLPSDISASMQPMQPSDKAGHTGCSWRKEVPSEAGSVCI